MMCEVVSCDKRGSSNINSRTIKPVRIYFFRILSVFKDCLVKISVVRCRKINIIITFYWLRKVCISQIAKLISKNTPMKTFPHVQYISGYFRPLTLSGVCKRRKQVSIVSQRIASVFVITVVSHMSCLVLKSFS